MEMTRLIGLLARNASKPSREPDPHVVEELGRETRDGADYDRYTPLKRSRAAIVLVHGATVHGSREERLVHFARSLARSGFTAIVPILPGLASCKLDPSDVDALQSVIETTAEGADGPPGLFGFSFGGSYSLVCACRAEVSPMVRFVIAIGAYHSLSELFAQYLEDDPDKALDREQWSGSFYLRLVGAHQNPERIGLSPEVQREVSAMLASYCIDASHEQKLSLYDRHLKKLDLRSCLPLEDLELQEALSPAGRLNSLACPVRLVHDVRDGMVPVSQAKLLDAELQGLASAKDHRLVITSLLNHVAFSNIFKLGQMLRLGRAIAPALRGLDRT